MVSQAGGFVGEGATTARLARAREVAIRRGDRVAYLYKPVGGHRAPGSNGAAHLPELATGVTETEGRALAVAGAKWIGPAEHAPGSRPYIERIRVRDFRCIKEVDFPLTPLHALIGPNDSGKSTLLEALRALSGGSPDGWREATAFWRGSALTSTASALFQHPANVDPENAESNSNLQTVQSDVAIAHWPSEALAARPRRDATANEPDPARAPT
jgi:hypothetical protein